MYDKQANVYRYTARPKQQRHNTNETVVEQVFKVQLSALNRTL